jgi:small-conductance mechanosensitive channel
MEITTFAIITAIPLIFLIIGYAFDSYLLKFLASMLLIMTGFFVATDQLTTITGSIIIDLNTTAQEITYTQTLIENGTNTILAITLGLLGLGLGYFVGRDYITETRGRDNE